MLYSIPNIPRQHNFDSSDLRRLGDLDNRGDDTNEMGDNLSELDLGDDFGDASEFALGYAHSCFLSSTEAKIKCVGWSDWGSLGIICLISYGN